MHIKKIVKVDKYKSFQDFSWHKFLNSEVFHDDINILYGENGTGKTSLCNILKSVSESKSFEKVVPTELELLIDAESYKFSNNNWDKNITKENVLFFDRDFIEKHVHVGHDRGSQRGQQEQVSGKMIIEFDADAINLKKAKEKLEEDKKMQNEIIEKYRKDNNEDLSFGLTEKEDELYKNLKNKDKLKIKNELQEAQKEKKDVDEILKKDKETQKSVATIQTDVSKISWEKPSIKLSALEEYDNVFSFDLKSQTQSSSKEELIEKITENKQFFELGFKIRKKNPKQCPFCESSLQEKTIEEILSLYEKIYDDTYKTQKKLFETKRDGLIEELDKIQSTILENPPSNLFIDLKKLQESYKIKDIYSSVEEENIKKITKDIDDEKITTDVSNKEITNVIKTLKELQLPNGESFSKKYLIIQEEYKNIQLFLDNLEIYISGKNKLINSFKDNNTDEKLTLRITENEKKSIELKEKIDFVQSGKIKKQDTKIKKDSDLQKLNDELTKLRVVHKAKREEYENYCSTTAFTNLLKKIEEYFQHFKFNFSLELDTTRNTANTKEFPFAFKVIDDEDNERDLKDGLSDGEIQVLSLCFFFAFLDIQENKSDKILVFDDPISSLDNSNLGYLVDLIAEEKSHFSQTFIFTHHRTFFKFLRKKFNKNCHEYNILRNKKQLGGSFICKSREEKFTDKLKNIEAHLTQLAQNPNGFCVELKIIEYGQYLRYEIEYYIKNHLLHWDKTNNFSDILDGIKSNKNITDDQLDELKQIYSFCNWTTSHVDSDDENGLEQLKKKINQFTSIID